MIRVLLSLFSASVVFGVAFTLFVRFTQTDSISIDLPSIVSVSIITLLCLLILALPWVPVMRRRSFIKAHQIIGLGITVACFPYLLFCLYILTVEPTVGMSLSAIIKTNARVAMDHLSFFFSAGFLCSLVIWAIGVRGNPYFHAKE